jgi:hypothetical protein
MKPHLNSYLDFQRHVTLSGTLGLCTKKLCWISHLNFVWSNRSSSIMVIRLKTGRVTSLSIWQWSRCRVQHVCDVKNSHLKSIFWLNKLLFESWYPFLMLKYRWTIAHGSPQTDTDISLSNPKPYSNSVSVIWHLPILASVAVALEGTPMTLAWGFLQKEMRQNEQILPFWRPGNQTQSSEEVFHT